MTEQEIIKAAMESCSLSQKELANAVGYSAQACVSSRLNGDSMRVDTFVKLLAAMGYRVVVESTSPSTNKNKWYVRETPEKHSRLDEIMNSYPNPAPKPASHGITLTKSYEGWEGDGNDEV